MRLQIVVEMPSALCRSVALAEFTASLPSRSAGITSPLCGT